MKSRTATEAQLADDPEARADAYYVMVWAYGELGKEEPLQIMGRSLETYGGQGTWVGKPTS